MFGIGGIEFAAIVILALLLLGPDKIPEAARTISRFMREFKRYQAMMESTFRAEIYQSEQESAAKKAAERASSGAESAPPKIPGEVGYESPSAAAASSDETVVSPEESADSREAVDPVAAEFEMNELLSEEDNPDALFDADEPGWTPGVSGAPGMEDAKEDGGAA